MASDGAHWTIQAEVSLDISDAEAKLKKLQRMAAQAASPGGGPTVACQCRPSGVVTLSPATTLRAETPLVRRGVISFISSAYVKILNRAMCRRVWDVRVLTVLTLTKPEDTRRPAQQNAKATGNKFREIFGKLFNTQNREAAKVSSTAY